MTRAELAGRIKKRRQRLGLTQTQLSIRVGVSQPTISEWESAGGVPEWDNLVALAGALEISLAGLVRTHKRAA